MKRRLTAASLLLSLLLLVSCASAPSARREIDWIAVLPAQDPATLYISVDVASSYRLLQSLVEAAGVEGAEIDRILGRTHRLYGRLRVSGAEPPSLSLVALADLTPTGAAFRLNHEPEWQRLVLEPIPAAGCWSSHWPYRTYWRHRSSGLEVAVPRRGVVFLCHGLKESGSPAMAGMLSGLHAPGINPLAPEAAEVLDSADLFLYAPDALSLAGAARPPSAGDAESHAPGLGNLPIREMWVRIDEAAGSYLLEAVLRLEEVKNPRTVETLLRLVLALWLRKAKVENPAALLKSLKISVDSGAARLSVSGLREREIISFFELFLPGLLGGMAMSE